MCSDKNCTTGLSAMDSATGINWLDGLKKYFILFPANALQHMARQINKSIGFLMFLNISNHLI